MVHNLELEMSHFSHIAIYVEPQAYFFFFAIKTYFIEYIEKVHRHNFFYLDAQFEKAEHSSALKR